MYISTQLRNCITNKKKIHFIRLLQKCSNRYRNIQYFSPAPKHGYFSDKTAKMHFKWSVVKTSVNKNATKGKSKDSLNKTSQCWKRCNLKHLEKSEIHPEKWTSAFPTELM